MDIIVMIFLQHYTQFLFSYLNTVVEDLLPDHVALLGCGDDFQESIGPKE